MHIKYSRERTYNVSSLAYNKYKGYLPLLIINTRICKGTIYDVHILINICQFD